MKGQIEIIVMLIKGNGAVCISYFGKYLGNCKIHSSKQIKECFDLRVAGDVIALDLFVQGS